MMEMFPALNKSDVDRNPIKQFAKWYGEATAAGIAETDAMTLATATKDGRPSARIVLLKEFDDRGFANRRMAGANRSDLHGNAQGHNAWKKSRQASGAVQFLPLFVVSDCHFHGAFHGRPLTPSVRVDRPLSVPAERGLQERPRGAKARA